MLVSPAVAQNATWLGAPANGNFNNAANWSPAGVPSGTAFFAGSSITNVMVSQNTMIGS